MNILLLATCLLIVIHQIRTFSSSKFSAATFDDEENFLKESNNNYVLKNTLKNQINMNNSLKRWSDIKIRRDF